MTRCALCHGKLGLGVRYRKLWNGRWWVHTRFCSAHCVERYNANTKLHWFTSSARLRSAQTGWGLRDHSCLGGVLCL